MSYESIIGGQRELSVTIIYLPLRWCGFAYKLFETILVKAQYYPPGSIPNPKRRLFAQYHAPQTVAMKEIVGMGDTIVMVSKSSILTKVSILSILAKSIGNSIPLGPATFLAKRLLSKAGEGR